MGDSYELVLVNDGSRDKTWKILQMLAHCDDRVVAVDLSRNHGHQLALSAGLSLARGERTLVIDADLQDPPELLPHMIQLMDDGADVVHGIEHGVSELVMAAKRQHRPAPATRRDPASGAPRQ